MANSILYFIDGFKEKHCLRNKTPRCPTRVKRGKVIVALGGVGVCRSSLLSASKFSAYSGSYQGFVFLSKEEWEMIYLILSK